MHCGIQLRAEAHKEGHPCGIARFRAVAGSAFFAVVLYSLYSV